MNRSKQPHSFSVVKAIGKVTFFEILRDKVLYNIALCSILLLGIGILASKLMYIHPERVILDVGLSAISLSCCVISIFTGASLLGREFERRTVFVALSRPITRAQFIVGKYLGLTWLLCTNWILLSGAYLFILALTSDGGAKPYSMALFAALLLTFIQSLFIGAIALFFSAFSTTSLSVAFSIGIYIIGNNISQIQFLISRIPTKMTQDLLKVLTLILPNMENFSLGLKVTYALPVSSNFVCFATLYGISMIILCLMLASFLIKGREV